MLATALATLVALIHVYILLLEMFWWNTPRGRKAFGLTPEFAASTVVLAKNQGLYNGFLAAGIFWALLRGDVPSLQFFMACVAVAGVFGAMSTGALRILLIQTGPALAALAALAWMG